ncbi:hypothetical protein EV174_004912, partial [Coemansia sp. RSA 2320]
MVSVELDGFIGEQRTLAVVERVMRFAVEMLANIKELWVSLPQDSGIAGKLLGHKYANVEEIRLVGRSAIQEIAPVLIPNYSRLTAISLDRQSAAATSCSELVVRSQQTLRELNIEEYTVELGSSLRLLPGSEWAAYPQLRQLAISQVAGVYDRWMVDGARLDAVEMLYFRDTEYPATGAGNRVLESTHVRLMGAAWARLRLLVVDSLSRGDVERLGSYAPRLEVLRVGLLGGDVHLEAGGQPAAALDLAAVAVILQTCRQLEDFSVETPEPYEDVYNARCPHSETVACWERPYDLGQRFGPLVVDPPHTRLRALMLNAWALTFDQLRSLFGALPALNSFEGNLKFTSDSYSSNFINDGRMGGSRLAHVSLVLSAPPTRHPRAFKSSLLRFVGGLPALRMLEIYGSADMPGIEDAVARVAPGCVAGFYSLTENGDAMRMRMPGDVAMADAYTTGMVKAQKVRASICSSRISRVST